MKVDYTLDDQVLLSFTDELKDPYNLGTFTRKLNRYTYYFVNGKLVVKSKEHRFDQITKIKADPFYSKRFITMDIATRTIENVITTYCICIFDGQISFSFYLSDYKDSDSMLEAAVRSIMKRKYENYKTYTIFLTTLGYFTQNSI